MKIGEGAEQGCSLSLILFKFSKEFLGGSGVFTIRGKVFRAVKYDDEVVLLAKEETVVQGITNQ